MGRSLRLQRGHGGRARRGAVFGWPTVGCSRRCAIARRRAACSRRRSVRCSARCGHSGRWRRGRRCTFREVGLRRRSIGRQIDGEAAGGRRHSGSERRRRRLSRAREHFRNDQHDERHQHGGTDQAFLHTAFHHGRRVYSRGLSRGSAPRASSQSIAGPTV